MLLRKIIQTLLLIILLVPTPSVLAWDATGHRLIAMIAYQNLTPEAKKQIDKLTNSFDPGYPALSRFTYAAVWADQIKYQDVNSYNDWHFINNPFSIDDTSTPPPSKEENIVWAIKQSERVLNSKTATADEKAFHLRFLMHLIGDAHQPLHCANRYSKEFPHGDQGGNAVMLEDLHAKNLHAFWDHGLDAWENKKLKTVAKSIMHHYPLTSFGKAAHDNNPEHWSKESLHIAIYFAYNIPRDPKLTKGYVTEGQAIAARRVALAGYRLANWLNHFYEPGVR